MSSLVTLLAKDSVDVAQLETIYEERAGGTTFVRNAIHAMRLLDPDLAWKAVWLLKRHAERDQLRKKELLEIARHADEMAHWISRLVVCQLFAIAGCPKSARENLFQYLVESARDRRPMIRAWSLTVLADFRAEHRYRTTVESILCEAGKDSAASVRARLKHVLQASPKWSRKLDR
jgi:hypothetical protein